MTLTKTFGTLGLLVTFFASTSNADTYRHIDELASSIERKARRIVSESHHYRHTPEYRHLLEDARNMCSLADHLHDVAHRHGSLAHMESDLRKLDSEFHHLESVFDRVERRASHGHGHIHGNTRHVKELLNSIEEDIHHLQDDIRSLRSHSHRGSRVVVSRPPIYAAPYAAPLYNRGDSCTAGSTYGRYGSGYGRPSYYGGNRGGLTIGGGSSRFTIRF